MPSDHNTFDYIIVGAGSAGCVLANRLTASGKPRVLLLEAGGKDTLSLDPYPGRLRQDTSTIRGSTGSTQTEPDPATANRPILQPRGKVLGGSSSINGLIYIRGQQEDYDHWRQLGNTGWSYDDVLPYFRKAENQQRGANEFHGADGPLKVSDPTEPHPLCDAFIESAAQPAIRANDDFNGADQEGFGYYQWTIRERPPARAPRRLSLRPAKKRPNLTVVTRAHATRILFDGQPRHRHRISRRTATRKTAAVEGEVHPRRRRLSTRRSSSQLSGIGPASCCAARHRVDRRAARASARISTTTTTAARSTAIKDRNTLNDAVADALSRGAWQGFRYVAAAQRHARHGGSLCGRLLQDRSATHRHAGHPGRRCRCSASDKAGDTLHPFPGITIVDRAARPGEQGHRAHRHRPIPSRRRRSSRTTWPAERDCDVAARGLQGDARGRGGAAMRSYIVDEHMPGCRHANDDELIDYLRESGGISFHPVATCRMGTDPDAVVDERLRVKGFTGLRVVDASIMPTIVSGNTNAPTIMIAEKGADMVLADAKAGAVKPAAKAA